MLVLMAAMIVFGLATPVVISHMNGETTPIRILTALGLLMPLGLMMGMLFPIGMSVASVGPARQPRSSGASTAPHRYVARYWASWSPCCGDLRGVLDGLAELRRGRRLHGHHHAQASGGRREHRTTRAPGRDQHTLKGDEVAAFFCRYSYGLYICPLDHRRAPDTSSDQRPMTQETSEAFGLVTVNCSSLD